MSDDRPLSHEERLEIFLKLHGLEQHTGVLNVKLEERGAATDRRLDQLERARAEDRKASAEEHKDLRADVEALSKAIDSGRLSLKDILVATSPLSVALLALIGVLLGGN